MARKTSKDTAPVVTEERPAPQPEQYIPKPCIYGLLVNDSVKYQQGQPAEIVGKWHVTFVDTRSADTAFGPYLMHDSQGQPLVGYVPVDMLKDVARKMWADDLGNYERSPFPLMSSGIKIMSCLVYD